MANQLEIQFLQGKRIPWGNVALCAICAILILFFAGKTWLRHEALPAFSNSADFSDLHYVGYLQTSNSLLALIQSKHQKLLSLHVGMRLLGCLVQHISPEHIQLLANNGETILMRFAGTK